MIPLKREIAEFQSASSINSEWLSVDLSRILFAISRAYKSQFCFERVAHQNQDQFWNSIKIILSSLLTNQYEFDSNGRNKKKFKFLLISLKWKKRSLALPWPNVIQSLSVCVPPKPQQYAKLSNWYEHVFCIQTVNKEKKKFKAPTLSPDYNLWTEYKAVHSWRSVSVECAVKVVKKHRKRFTNVCHFAHCANTASHRYTISHGISIPLRTQLWYAKYDPFDALNAYHGIA